MATTLDWIKSSRADKLCDYVKGWDLKIREVCGKMVMQIDRIDENYRSTSLTNIRRRKEKKYFKCDCLDKRFHLSQWRFFERSL